MLMCVYKYLQEKAYLEPDFEVERGAGMSGTMEEAKSNTAINTAAEKNCHLETLIGHRTREITWVNISIGG